MAMPKPRRSRLALALSLLLATVAHAQNFLQPKVIPTGNWPAAIYTADMNGDGYPDLIYIDQGAQPGQPSTTHVLLNDGKGNFTPSATIATVGNSLAIGAFGGQGFPSVGWATPIQGGVNVSIARGMGNGTFTSIVTKPAIYPTGTVPLPIAKPASLDYLALGRTAATSASVYSPYLYAQDSANNILYAVIFNPDGTTALQVAPLPDGAGPATLVPQRVPANPASTLSTLIINGQSGAAADIFTNGAVLAGPTARFPGVNGIHSLLAQDVNGDGIPDLIAEGPSGHLDVFLGNGDGTFATTSSSGTGLLNGLTGNGGHLITVADLNHDGLPDALTATPAGVSSLLGQGTQYLGLKGIFNAGPGMHTFATADFNGDGSLDLATDSPEGIALLYGNPDGTFQTSRAFAAGQPALSGTLGAFTTSGHLDALVSTGATQSQLLLGNGAGAFTAVGGADSPTPTTTSNGPAGLWSSVLAADLNHDGNLDLVITADGASNPASGGTLIPATGEGTLYQLGNGDGTFQPPATFPASTRCPSPNTQSCLYGTNSLVLTGGPSTLISDFLVLDQQGLEFLLETGEQYNFGTATLDQDPHPHNLLKSGINGGAPGSTNGRNQMIVLEDESSLKVIANANPSETILRGDLHIDGSLTTPGQLTAPDISATFPGPSQALGFRAFPSAAAIADLDGSGGADLAVLYANLDADQAAPTPAKPNYLYLWFNSAGNFFNEVAFLTTPAHPVNPVRIQLSRNYDQIAFADLNGDGIPDLILSDGYLVDVQYGKGDGTFGAENHLLAGQGINSLLLADANGDGQLDLVTANGGATLSNPVANLEVLAKNPDVNTGGITVLLNNIPKASPTVTGALTAAPNPAAFEAAYTLTATLTPSPGAPAPTGTVTFLLGSTTAGSAPVINGIATLTVPAHLASGAAPILPGTYTLSATYSGDTNYLGEAILGGPFTVSLAPTTVTLTPTTPLQTQYGGPANGLFSVSVLDGNYPATGTYTLYDNGIAVPICTNLPLYANGQPVNCPYGDPVLLDAGSHTFTITYNGDPINAPSTSNAVTYAIAPDPTVTLGLTSSLPVAPFGAPVTFTATVTGTLAIPSGLVTFYSAPFTHPVLLPIGTGTLNAAGVATFTTASLTIGTYEVTAAYAGNQNFNPSGTGFITQVITAPVVQLPSSVALTSSQNPSVLGQTITLTAQVSTQAVYAPIPSGTVTFLDGQAVLAAVPLNRLGIATLTLSTLASGIHTLTAAYGGATGLSPVIPPGPQPPPGSPGASASLTLLPGVSPSLSQAVNVALNPAPGSFVLNVSPVPVNLGVGRTAILLVQVNPIAGFAQPVALSCGPLPYEVTCTFALPTIPPGGGATTLNLATNAPHDCGNPNAPYFLGDAALPGRSFTTFAAIFVPGLGMLGLGMLGLGMLEQIRRNRRRALLRSDRVRALLRDLTLLALAAAGLASLSGCGHCTDLGTRPGSYTFTVVATPVGTPITQTVTQTIQLTTHD